MGSLGSMEVAGIKMGKLPEHKATSYMVSKQYRKMKIISCNWYNLGGQQIRRIQDICTKQNGNMKIDSENQVNLDTHMSQSKPKDTSKSNDIISRINIDKKQLSELVSALEADDLVTFRSVVKPISNCKERGLDLRAIIQGIQISGSEDTLIHAAARHKAVKMLYYIGIGCPALLTAKNFDGDTVWHVVASEGVDQLLKQLRAVRREHLVNPETYKGGNSLHFRLNDVNNQGNTALHTAIVSGNESIANGLFKMILDDESSLCYLPNKEGKSAIYLAAEAGYEKLLRPMMNAAMKHPRNLRKILKGKSIIHAAITAKQLVSLTVIMEEAPELFLLRDETEMTPLQWAAKSDGSLVADLKPKLVKLLMRKHLLMGKL